MVEVHCQRLSSPWSQWNACSCSDKLAVVVVSINVAPDTIAWGPGVAFPFESNVPGPQVLPLHIHFELHETSTEKLIWVWDLTDPFQAAARGQARIFYDENNEPVPVPISQSVKDNDTAIMQIVVRDDRQVIIDQGELTLPWSNTAGITNELRQIGGTQGGFTTTDRLTLNTTADQTQVAIPTNIAGFPNLISPLADWLNLSHGTRFVRGDVQLLSGRGSVNPRPAALPWAFGAFFTWFTVPAELGVSDGLQPVYHDELFQIGIVYADLGLNEYYDRLLGYTTDGHFIEWPSQAIPHRIDYWVMPGVTVAWQFMLPPAI